MTRIIYVVTLAFFFFLHVALSTQLLEMPARGQAFRNPGSWVSVYEQQEESFLTAWNVELRKEILQNTSSQQNGEILAGMLLGGQGMDEVTREIFAKNGLAHLLSVSGTHLLLLVVFLNYALTFVPPQLRRFLIFLVLLFYALLCGLRPPVLRALLMSSILLFGGRGGRKGILLCLVAVVLLCYKPWWLYDVGMQLSFGAAFSLVFFTEKCRRVLPLPECMNFLRESLAITCAAQVGVLPILTCYFHELSIISLISNLFLVPLLEIAALLGALACLFWQFTSILGITSFVASFCFYVADFLVTQVQLQAQFLAKLSWSTLVVPSLPSWCLVFYYALLLLWADLPLVQFFSKQERRALIFCLSVSLLGVYAYERYAPKNFTVYFLDVGQGDCVVLEMPERQVVVYDTGGLKYYSTGSRILAPFLKSLGYGKVDYLFLSHYDYDHVGGASSFLRNMEAKNIILPAEMLTEENIGLYQELEQYIGSAKIGKASEFACVNFGAVALQAFCVEKNASGNEASTVLAVRSPQGSVLLTGDLGKRGEEMLDVGHYDILKVGHHGSRNSSSEAFLASVKPHLAVISCAARNIYGHPHAETLARLADVGAQVVRTDVSGAIKVELAQQGMFVQVYASGGWQDLPADSF